MKINLTTIIITVLLVSYLIGSTVFGYKMYQAFNRVENNQTILLDNVKDINKDKQLVLTPKEFRESLDSSTTAILKSLDLKAKNITQLVKASSNSQGNVNIPLRDTSITINNTIMAARTFTYDSKFLDLEGIITSDTIRVDWTVRDNINFMLYWKREGKFIPKLFGKKVYRVVIKGENPYTDYIVNQNIKIEKE